jgi:hypothetical protein
MNNSERTMLLGSHSDMLNDHEFGEAIDRNPPFTIAFQMSPQEEQTERPEHCRREHNAWDAEELRTGETSIEK